MKAETVHTLNINLALNVQKWLKCNISSWSSLINKIDFMLHINPFFYFMYIEIIRIRESINIINTKKYNIQNKTGLNILLMFEIIH